MSKIHSIAAQEKFNTKVIKLLKQLGAVSTNNPNYPDQYLVETIAGPLKVTLFPAQESQVFSIISKFTDLEKVEEARRVNKLPFLNHLNSTTGKYNFIHTSDKRTMEEFSIAMTKIHTPGFDLTFTVRIKEGKNPPEFLDGLGKGVIEKRVVTYKVTEEEFRSPMCQMNIQEAARQLLEEYFEVTIEQGNTIPKIKNNGKG